MAHRLGPQISVGMALLVALTFVLPPHAFGHPMGNFSINHYAAIRVGASEIELRYLIDMAEIPTFQELQQSGFSPQSQSASLNEYLIRKGAEFSKGLQLTINGHPSRLQFIAHTATFPPGAGNLPTMRMEFVYRADIPPALDSGRVALGYRDDNFPNRAGWKEIIAIAEPGTSILSSTAGSHDRSDELASYPTDLLSAPPQDLEAHLTFSIPSRTLRALSAPPAHPSRPSLTSSPKTPAPQPPPPSRQPTQVIRRSSELRSPATPRNAFTELIRNSQRSAGFLFLAAFIAAGLGALHALEPGHGKTIVAAYLVGSKGTARHAFLLGLTVTVSHTAGVYLLGAITIYAQHYILPERVYPFLAVLSGVFIAAMGTYLFMQRFVPGGLVHAHSHGPGGHQHFHFSFWHSHSHEGVANESPAPGRNGVSPRELLLLGITGGIVPCPAALVVLLSAAALGRPAFGLFLILCFSVGLAAVLIAMGLVAVYAARAMSRLPVDGPVIQHWLPMASASLIIVIGWVMALNGLITAGIFHLKV